MRGIRLWLSAALVGLVASSGCCRWWCNNCERFCRDHHAAPQPVPIAPPIAQTQCVPICQPICCPPGTVPIGAPVASQGWR